MYGREKHVLLRHYHEQGMSKAAIARELGVDRRTIYRWVGVGDVDRGPGEELVRYGPRVPKPTKLDPYKGIIQARLEAYTELSAIRLLDEIRAAGYRGGYTQFKEYVRQVRPRPPADPVVRFETPPAHQGQVDFADFRLPWDKRYAFLVVLGSLASCGCSSSAVRRCRRCSRAWKGRLSSSVACPVSCCSTR